MNKVIHLFFPGPFGGAEKVILKGLEDLKEKVSLSLWIIKETRCPEHADYFEKECLRMGIDNEMFECQSIFDFGLLKRLKSQVPKNAIIHAHGMKASFYAAFLPGQLVITHHGHTSHTLKVKVYEFIQELIMRKADRVISVSHPMHEELDRKNIKSSLIENMLSMEPAISTYQETQETHFVFIGRLSPEKGANILVTALKNMPMVKLSIVGDGVEKEQLEKRVIDEEIKNIEFLGFQSDVSPYLKDAHALIMPSLREGLPMTLLEAICGGLPVIGSDVGGLKGLVKQNGILVPPGDPVALNKAIQIFVAKRDGFTQNAQALSEIFINRFSVKNWSYKTVEIYKRLSSQS